MIEEGSNSYFDEDAFDDESVWERIVGLTEMFPEPVRNATTKSAAVSWRIIKKAYSLSCSVGWMVSSVVVVGAVPVLFEIQRDTILAEEANQQRKLMFGPQTDSAFAIPPTIRAV